MRRPLGTLEARCDGFWDRPLGDLLERLHATPAGLTSEEAARRRRLHGPNSLAEESRFATLVGFLRFFANPLVIVLLVASAISLVLGDPVGLRAFAHIDPETHATARSPHEIDPLQAGDRQLVKT